MDFDIEKDFGIFDSFLQRRPEIFRDLFKNDLKNYYLPYIDKLFKLKEEIGGDSGLIVGVSAIQGTGKTTQGEILEILFSHFRKTSVSLSIDDHYITHKQLVELRQKDPRFIRRGVTHDIGLAVKNLNDLLEFSGGGPVFISGYDKGAQQGDGDRFAWINPVEDLKIIIKVIESDLVINKALTRVKALQIISANYASREVVVPENMGACIPVLPEFLPDKLVEFLNLAGDRQITVLGKDSGAVYFISSEAEVAVDKTDLPKGWRLVGKKPDFIFYDGWMVGVRKVEDETVFDSGLPALETEEARQFAKFINNKLTDYEPLWKLFNFMNVLYVPNYQISLRWRDQAEQVLREKGEGMSSKEIEEFVYYFWRSVHPAIQIKNLAFNEENADQVVIINDDHTIKEVLVPKEVKARY
ncbi:MAG TPA: hypothetical protein VJG66_04905 [Patescibacteria group bacterium]|nr:hypothetical protein [Patescibacteria group bacterium]